MAWIKTIREDEWEGDLGGIRSEVVHPEFDRVDNIIQVHSLNPRAMAAHNGLYQSAMASTAGLPKVERELVALVVSNINECHY